MRSNLCVSLAVLLSVAGAADTAPATPTIYNLGALYGPTSGADINASGEVTGTGYIPGEHFSYTYAFLYTGVPGSGGVMHDIGGLGGSFSEAYAINDSGQVAGYAAIADDIDYHAFLYTGLPGSGVMHDLGTLGGTASYGWAINASGQVTGSSSTEDGALHAFLYTGTPGNGGVMHDLSTVGGLFSEGYAINDSGQVAGYSYMPGICCDHAYRAFLYTGMPGSGGVMHGLGTLGGTQSIARGINDNGQVVGWSKTAGDAAEHAFLYAGTPGSDGAMHDLGTLGGTRSDALDINAAGDIVGWSNTAGGETHAFVYTGTPGVDGEMIDLDVWLDSNDPAEGAKWTLNSAEGLNDHGLITGGGFYDDGPGGASDGTRAYVLDASSLLLEPPGLPGDYNQDGAVDTADYVVWRKNGGTQQGYNTWRAHFGQTSGNSAAMSENAVPEPSGLALLTLAVPPLLRRQQPHISKR